MEESKQGNFEFSLEWQSRGVNHLERYYISRVNLWRDYFPGQLSEKLGKVEVGETAHEPLQPGQIVDPFSKDRVYKFLKRKLNLQKLADQGILLRVGRYYPRSALAGVGFTCMDMRPFKVLENEEEYIVIDINHPLVSFPVTVGGKFLKFLPSKFERGGSSNDIGYALTDNGPGLQAIHKDHEPDFFIDEPFCRTDENDDALFYHSPRLVDHIDAVARDQISKIYERFLQPGMKVLDLMSSWHSHLPQVKDLSVTGLGMNREELEKNTDLSAILIHDLNKNPEIPLPDNEFDLAICTVSIEYLTDPVAVLKDVARVLKPGTPLMITFSDRYFPSKVVQIWNRLHPFERLALVTTYLNKTGMFEQIHTETVRGYPRLYSDPYFNQRHDSDSVFAVWGYVRK